MRIFVKPIDGKTISLDVLSTDLIESIKSKMQNIQGIPVDKQRLIFAGEEFEE